MVIEKTGLEIWLHKTEKQKLVQIAAATNFPVYNTGEQKLIQWPNITLL